MNFTDKDIVRFLTNVECLEGLFDTWGVFGQGFNNNLTLGAPTPIGAKKANLSQEVRSHLMEVALNEQVGGHPPPYVFGVSCHLLLLRPVRLSWHSVASCLVCFSVGPRPA